MKITVGLIISVVLLSACGGGSSDSATPVAKEDPKLSGIYQSSDAVMLVDTSLNNGVIAADSSGNVFTFDAVTQNNNELNLKGVHLWSPAVDFYDSSLGLEISFTGNVANAMATIDNKSFVHTFKKQADSLPLNKLVGTHTNEADGSTWTIDANGNLTINGMCTFTGKITAKDYYYKATADATGCSSSTYDGKYEGYALTINESDHMYFVGALYNDLNMVWAQLDCNYPSL
ncbi:hypothetical protein [Photobacterium profundum]|uniref:Lipoprotein n=1 Tax=Photobacterium profundum (strain SS9) TaxID=298386 RepID=Q6LIS3_PHOPR|nr:hypothetical protein [Photobacterium profundum]CAG22807.1 hypothetical protein PBPRB0935 [Photobacterium profundum SS9]